MVTLLDLEAMKAAHAHVEPMDAAAAETLADLATELASILRTCGFYFFVLQLCGAYKGEKDTAKVAEALREPLEGALEAASMLFAQMSEDEGITPGWALRQCEVASLPQLLLLKEFTATFLAYVHFEAKAKQNGG